MTILVYNHIITLDAEVGNLAPRRFPLLLFDLLLSIDAKIVAVGRRTRQSKLRQLTNHGRSRWSLGKILFLVNRYIIQTTIMYVPPLPLALSTHTDGYSLLCICE